MCSNWEESQTCKIQQPLSAIAVLLLRITFSQPAQAHQLELVSESRRCGTGYAIDFLGG